MGTGNTNSIRYFWNQHTVQPRGYGEHAPRQSYVNVDPLIGSLISERQATLVELRTIYDYEDALNMYECVMIPKINEHLAIEFQKKQKGK